MARGKKKESALTPEEKLAQALVPVEEQPYKVPENWCWVRLGSLGYTNIGLTYKPANISPTGTIVLRSSNIQNGQMDYSDIVSVDMDIPESKMSQKGDILICARNGSKALVGKTAIIDRNGMSYGAFMAIFRSPYNSLIYHYLNSHYFRDIIDHDVGTTTINQITQSLIKELPFPLPPFAEQQRIVDRIEYLFAKLDEAKEKAQSVLDSFETRKAAILHKAFTGELTAKWRAEHGVSADTWVEKQLIDFLSLITYGFTNPMPDADEGPWKITAKSVHDGYIDYEVSRKTTQEAFDNLLTDKSRPLVNDVLLTKDGSIGRVAVVDRPSICINQSVALLRPNEKIHPEFLRDMLLSPQHQRTMELQAGGTALKHIYITRVNKMKILVPSLAEQEEVCNVVKNLLTKEQQAKEVAEAVLEKIDLLKKSILARAFRGELGTNDPTEESAIAILKTIL